MISLLGAEKAFAKINIHSWIQNFRKLEIDGNLLNLVKVIYQKNLQITSYLREKEQFPLTTMKGERISTLTASIEYYPGGPHRCIKARFKKKNGIKKRTGMK